MRFPTAAEYKLQIHNHKGLKENGSEKDEYKLKAMSLKQNSFIVEIQQHLMTSVGECEKTY